MVLATSVSIRRVRQTTVPAVYVATRLISRLGQHWRVSLEEMSDDRIVLAIWVDEASDRPPVQRIEAEIRANFPAETNPGWALEFV